MCHFFGICLRYFEIQNEIRKDWIIDNSHVQYVRYSLLVICVVSMYSRILHLFSLEISFLYLKHISVIQYQSLYLFYFLFFCAAVCIGI